MNKPTRTLCCRALACLALCCIGSACAGERGYSAPLRPFLTSTSHALPDGTEYRVASGIATARSDPSAAPFEFFETRTGAYVLFDSKGRVDCVLAFRDGILHGPYHRYGSNGELAELGWFDSGKPTGTWVLFHGNGVASAAGRVGARKVVVNSRHEVRLDYFEKRGEWRSWDEHGKETGVTQHGDSD